MLDARLDAQAERLDDLSSAEWREFGPWLLLPLLPLAALLAAELSARGRPVEALDVQRKRFSDGELYQRFLADVRGREVILVSGTHDEVSTLTAYDLACAAARYGAA